MARKMFVNLPVKDLNKSVDFFTKLGFKFNPQFTDENATCMIVGEDSFAMLLVEKYFQTFTKKKIADSTKATEVLIALSADSKKEVEDIVNNAVKAGGSLYNDPQDQGWMYQHSFQDLDGHQWEIVYMDMDAVPQS